VLKTLWPQVKEDEVGMEPRHEEELYEKAPFRLQNPAVHEYILWLWHQGANTERVVRLMLLVHENAQVQGKLYDRIRESYHGLTKLEDLENAVDRILYDASGAVESSIGLDDILTLGAGRSAAGRIAKAGAREATVTGTQLGVRKLGLKPETWTWGRKLMDRCKKLGVPVDRHYIARRMKLYDQYAGKVGKAAGRQMRTNKGYRGVPKHSTYPLLQPHPKSMLRPTNRWNTPGEGTVSFGTTRKATAAEMESWYGNGWETKYTVKRRYLSADNMLDLTDRKTLELLEIDPKILNGNDPALGQVISSIARDLGFEGVISRSAALDGRGSKNINLFGK